MVIKYENAKAWFTKNVSVLFKINACILHT